MTDSSERAAQEYSSSTSQASDGSSVSNNNTSSDATQSSSSQNSSGDSVFDDTDATYDPNACLSTAVSATPLQDTANTSRETADLRNGLTLKSLYRETDDQLDSLVTLYYNTLPSDTVLTNQMTFFYFYDELKALYYIAYDLAWVDTARNTVYIKLPQQDAPKAGCYKLILNNTEGTKLSPVKVFR